MRETIAALLAAHVPADETEADDLEKMRSWVRELPAPTAREQPGAHFTASAIVVDPPRERTLLIHHRKAGKWFQPGGHMEPGDSSPAEAALREAREETGLDAQLVDGRLLDVDVHWISWEDGWHLDLRFLVVAAGELSPQAAEVHGAEWLTLAEAFARTDEAGLRRALAKVG